MTARPNRQTLRPDEERRLASAERACERAFDSVDAVVAQASRLVADVDSAHGVVLAPIEEDDSVVIHLRAHRLPTGTERPR